MPAGKDEGAERRSQVGEEARACLQQWQDGLEWLTTVCWGIWQAWRQKEEKKPEHCILFLLLGKEIFKKETNKKPHI